MQFSVIAAILVSLTTNLGFMVLDQHEHGLTGKLVESEKIKIRVKRETMVSHIFSFILLLAINTSLLVV